MELVQRYAFQFKAQRAVLAVRSGWCLIKVVYVGEHIIHFYMGSGEGDVHVLPGPWGGGATVGCLDLVAVVVVVVADANAADAAGAVVVAVRVEFSIDFVGSNLGLAMVRTTRRRGYHFA